MLDPSSPDGQAILQQVGVSYDTVIFYVSSNLVGKRVRDTRCCYLRGVGGPERGGARCGQATDGGVYSDPAPHSVHRIYDTRSSQFLVRLPTLGHSVGDPEVQNMTGTKRSFSYGVWDHQ